MSRVVCGLPAPVAFFFLFPVVDGSSSVFGVREKGGLAYVGSGVDLGIGIDCKMHHKIWHCK